MAWVTSTLITGVAAFIATNIDDILILMVFFVQVSDRFRPRHIVAGQYLGFCTLLLASLPGYLGGLVVSKPWLGLLGLLPIVIGIQTLRQQNKSDTGQSAVQVVSIPVAKNNKQRLIPPQIYQVAAVTIANGGDNIGIYIPLFAGSNLAQLTVIVGVFLGLVALWCVVAYYLVQRPAIAQLFTRYGHRLVPFLLIGLGLYILVENGSYHFFLSWLELYRSFRLD
jgi:cadmium resistance transport/sequestration family protein